MSLKSSLWRYLGLLAVAALAVGVFAGPASAKKLSAKQRAAIRKQLRKQVKKHPGVVRKKSFIKRASLVNFKLPVTIRLRGANAASNPNNATVDLGASLGKREVDLGGSLSAQIRFHDTYDGGALGNVDLEILPSANHHLTSTSIPLLWNTQVHSAGTSWDSNMLNSAGFPAAGLSALGHAPGCGDVLNSNTGTGTANSTDLPFGKGVLNSDGSPAARDTLGNLVAGNDGLGLPGVPIHSGASTVGFAPSRIAAGGVDNSIDAIKASKIPGNNDYVGGNPNPFPYGTDAMAPMTAAPDQRDTVLRTNALDLNVAQVGTEVNNATKTNDGSNSQNGVNGGQSIVIGKSGGQANLFGNIPGRDYGIDVTVNLATKINSIIRMVDQDAFEPLNVGGNWPAAVFTCGQIWTGAIQNYIPSVRLAGNLKIAPGLTADGHLRIAKATVSTPNTGSATADVARFAVAACLAPYSAYNTETGNNTVPAPDGSDPKGVLSTGQLPVDPATTAPAPAGHNCNEAPTPFVANSALPTDTVGQLAPAVPADGYTTTNSGAAVSVAADLDVKNVAVDVLIGDV